LSQDFPRIVPGLSLYLEAYVRRKDLEKHREMTGHQEID